MTEVTNADGKATQPAAAVRHHSDTSAGAKGRIGRRDTAFGRGHRMKLAKRVSMRTSMSAHDTDISMGILSLSYRSHIRRGGGVALRRDREWLGFAGVLPADVPACPYRTPCSWATWSIRLRKRGRPKHEALTISTAAWDGLESSNASSSRRR